MSQEYDGVETTFPCKMLYEQELTKSEESKILFKISTVMREAHLLNQAIIEEPLDQEPDQELATITQEFTQHYRERFTDDEKKQNVAKFKMLSRSFVQSFKILCITNFTGTDTKVPASRIDPLHLNRRACP